MYALSRRVRLLLHALDGFVLTAVGSLVLLHIAPRALALGGLWSVAAAAIGIALPALFERMVFGQKARGWAIVLGLIGLVSHTLIDGAAIGSEHHPSALSWAIVVHRLPAGILVWWLVRPAFGLPRASLMLAGLIAATIAGYLLGARFDFVEERSLAVFEAFVAGALFHVLLSHGPELHGESGPHNRVAELFGAALGVVVVVFVPESSGGHGHGPLAFDDAGALLRLTQAISLPLIAGLAIAGILCTGFGWRPRGLAAAFLRPAGSARALRDFRVNGDLTALLATPQLGPGALLISLILLGPWFTAVRVASAIGAASLVSLLVRRASGPPLVQLGLHPQADAPPLGWLARASAAVRFGFRDLMDESAAWILFGVAMNLLMAHASFDLPPWIAVPLAALLALLPFVCAIGATPLVAAALAAGLSPGSGLAFLIAGSMVNTSALAAVGERYPSRAKPWYAGGTLVAASLAGFAADRLLPPLSIPTLSLELEGSLDRAAAILLLASIAGALVRLGPRGFVQTLLRPTASGAAAASEHHHHHH